MPNAESTSAEPNTAEPTSTVQIRVMGAPSVQIGTRIAAFKTRKALALALYLALEGPQPQDTLLELLWPDAPNSGSLRTAALHVRQALGQEAGRLQTHWCGLSLDLSGAQLDVWAVGGLDAGAALAWPHSAFLAGLYLRGNAAWDSYLTWRGETLRDAYDQRLAELFGAAMQSGDFAQASALAGRRCDLDPLSETACSQWAAALQSAGLRRRAQDVLVAFARRFEQMFGPAARPTLHAGLPTHLSPVEPPPAHWWVGAARA